MVYVLGLGAAFLLAVGFVTQHYAAEREPLEWALRPRLLLDLMRRPVWLAGIAAMVGGQLLSAGALDHGDVTLVEPLLAANLVFALPMTAIRHHVRVRPAEIGVALVVIAGLAGFVAAGHPEGGGAASVKPISWLISLLAAAVTAGGLTVLAGKVREPFRATLFATSAGILFGYQDAITRPVVHDLGSRGIASLLTNWEPYVLVFFGAAGVLLAQSSFEAVSLRASLPALTAAEPITGIALGVGLYGEQIRSGIGPLSVQVVSLIAVVAGVIVLSQSPVVTGDGRRLRHRRQQASR